MNLKGLVTKAQLIYFMSLVAATIVEKFNSVKNLFDSLTANNVSFSDESFDNSTDNVAKALKELMDKYGSEKITFEKLQTANEGKLATYRFTKGTGIGAQTMDIDIEKDKIRAIVGFTTISEDDGRFYDGDTEVGASEGVTKAGVYLKSKVLDAQGVETGEINYADASAVIEYLTVGVQTGKTVTLSIDPDTHTITADIADKAITKAKLEEDVQKSLDLANNAIQEDDLGEVSDSDILSAWTSAVAAAENK